MRRTTTLAVSMMLLVAVQALAIPEGPPGTTTGDDATPLKGLALSADAQLFTGAATTSIPIELPPGRREMTPNLALAYSSQNGHGPLGAGWDLPLGRIERSTRLGAPRYSTADGFVAILPDGAIELVPLPDGSYGARIDESHVRVTVNAAGNVWQLHDKSGRDYYFGTTAESRVGPYPPSFDGTFAWHLTQVRDPNGNTIDITYGQHSDALGPTGQAYPIRLDYGGNGGVGHVYRVDFFWLARSQGRRVSYAAGFRTAYDRYLAEIYVTYTGSNSQYSGALVRRYSFDWEPSATSGAPLLREVQLYGSDQSRLSNEDGTPASTKLTYNETPMLPFSTTAVSADVKVASFRDTGDCTTRDFLDLNGDGRPDLVRTGNWTNTNKRWQVHFNRGPTAVPMFDTTATNWPAPIGCIEKRTKLIAPELNQAASWTKWALFDMDGDGRPDLVDGTSTLSNSRWTVYLNLGNGFATVATPWDIPSCNSLESAGFYGCTDALRSGNTEPGNDWTYRDTLDLNGDGRPEHIVTRHGGLADTWVVWRNAGYNSATGRGTFFPPEFIPAPHPYIRNGGPDTDHQTIKSDLFDLNGDGLPDKVAAKDGHWDVWYGNGRFFEPVVQWTAPNGTAQPYLRQWDDQLGEYLYDILDVNADGLPDFVNAGPWSSSNKIWRVSVNLGQGFAPPASWPAPAKLRKKHPNATREEDFLHIDTFDIDGNGYPDSIMLPGDNRTTAQIWLGHPTPAPSDSLATVSNNPGHRTTVFYDVAKPVDLLLADGVDPTLNAGAGYHLPFPIWVVGKIYIDDLSGPADVFTTYRYMGGYFDGTRREFRGFGAVIATDPYGAASLTKFRQTDALRGKPNVESVIVGDPLALSPNYLRRTVSTWAVVDLLPTPGVRQAVRLQARDRTDFSSATDAQWIPTTFRRAMTTYAYDDCGNITDEQVQEFVGSSPVVRRDTTAAFASLNGGCTSHKVCVGICDRASTLSVAGGLLKTLAYDGRGNLTRTVLSHPSSPTTTMTYDGYGNVLETTEPEGATTTFLYQSGSDSIHPTRLIRQGGGALLVSFFDYDSRFGKVTMERGPNAETRRTEYDAFGRVSKVAEDQQTLTNPTRSYRYVLGPRPRVEIRRLEPSHPFGSYTAETVIADALGRPLQRLVERNVEGVWRSLVLGATERELGGRVRREFVPFAAGVSTQAVSVPSQHASTMLTYDQFSRVISRTLPDGIVLQTSRAKAWVTRTCDGRHGADPATGSCTEDEVDALGRLVVRRTYTGASTTPYAFEQYTYDPGGRLIGVRQNGNNATGISMAYDGLNRKISQTDPDLGTWRYNYDRNGNLVYRDDPVAGRHLEFVYDSLSRLVRRSVRASDTQGQGTATVLAEYDYDSATSGDGRLGRVVDASGETRIDQYDRATGQIKRATKTITFSGVTKTFTTQNGFDTLGRLASTTVPYPDASGDETVTLRYSDHGLPTRLHAENGTFVTDVRYNEFANPVAISYGHHGSDAYTYGSHADRRRLRGIVTQAGVQAREIAYQYEANDNVSAVTDAAATPSSDFFAQTATYDNLGRLTNSMQTGYTGTFGYNEYGNLTAKDGKNYFYDQSPHRPTRVGTDAISYDANGNMIGLPGGRSLIFDAEGRLVEVKRNGTTIARYLYDHAGERVAAQTSEGTTFFFPGFDVHGNTVVRHFSLGDRLIASSPVSGGDLLTASAGQTARAVVVARALVTGSTVLLLGFAIMLPGRRRGATVAVVAFFVAAQLPLPRTAHAQCDEDLPPPPGTIFYHPDHLGTPALISSADTSMPAEYLLTRPYGESGGTFDRLGTPLGESRADFRFTGHRAEDATGLTYMGARYYDAGLAVFVSPDPAQQFFSPYGYGGGNPLNGRDPNGAIFGLDDIVVGIIVGSIIAATASGIQALLNGASPFDAFKAASIGAAVGAGSGALFGAAGFVASTGTVAQQAAYNTVMLGFSSMGAAQSIESGQYVAASAAIAGAALSAAGLAGTLRSTVGETRLAANDVGSTTSDASVDYGRAYDPQNGQAGQPLIDPVSIAAAFAAGMVLRIAGLAARGVAAVIRTPYALEVQSASIEAQAALAEVQGGATLYRMGELGRSMAGESQYWSLSNPLSPGYASQMGMPTVAPNFVMGGTLARGASVVTNSAAALGPNVGGAVQAVTSPGGVTGLWFHMP
jgi:RHS repeat-associated protein